MPGIQSRIQDKSAARVLAHTHTFIYRTLVMATKPTLWLGQLVLDCAVRAASTQVWRWGFLTAPEIWTMKDSQEILQRNKAGWQGLKLQFNCPHIPRNTKGEIQMRSTCKPDVPVHVRCLFQSAGPITVYYQLPWTVSSEHDCTFN